MKLEKTKQRVFKESELKSHEIDLLIRRGYKYVKQRNLEGKEEYYLFLPFYHESARHAVAVYEIFLYLKRYTRFEKIYSICKDVYDCKSRYNIQGLHK